MIIHNKDRKPSLFCFTRVTRCSKETEEALRHSEQQFRALFEFSPDAIIASDKEGKSRR